ncbi:hypothetical protein MMC30_009030 [Trapelia coarctata]|nr:hypothetical protein [Trapelia coarctata]
MLPHWEESDSFYIEPAALRATSSEKKHTSGDEAVRNNLRTSTSTAVETCNEKGKTAELASTDAEKQAVECRVEEPSSDSTSQKGAAEEEVKWDDNDPEDPYNWPTRKKWSITLLTSGTGLVTLMSGTMMAPALTTIGPDLDLNEAATQLALSIFLLSFAFGPMVLAPMTELYGRRSVWLLAGVWYALWNMICGFSHNSATMIAGRFLSGLGASAEFAVSSPVLADMWHPEQRGHSIAIASFIPLLGTAVGPIIGGAITQAIGWRWLFWTVSIFSAMLILTGFITFKETFAPILLARRAKMIRATTGRQVFAASENFTIPLRKKLWINVTRPLRLLATQPALQVMAIFMAYNFGINYIMLSTFAQLWTDRYGQTVEQSGLNYIALAIGNSFAAQVGAKIMDRVWTKLKARAGGVTAPEYRVPMMVPGSLLVPIGLFWYGWAGEMRAHWLLTDVGVGLFTCGIILASQSMQVYVIDSFPRYVASASAGSQLLRFLAAFVFPIFAPAMYNALGYGWGNSVLGFCSLIIGVPAPLLIWKYGAKLRAMGKPQW